MSDVRGQISERKYLFCLWFFIFCFLTSCGFQPVYYSGENAATVAALREVRVEPIVPGRIGQELHNALEDLFYVGAAAVPTPRYALQVSLTRNLQPLVIEKDREITRYNLEYSAVYTLTSLDTHQKIHEGKSRITGSYDATASSDFATYAAEKDTESRVMDEMARDIFTRLSAYFLQNR